MSTKLTNAEITEKITGFREGREGKYWNKYPCSDSEESEINSRNWGLTDTKCQGSNVYKDCTSNRFGGGRQCHGFAKFISYLIFGSYPKITMGDNSGSRSLNDGWYVYQGNYDNVTLEPGDFIRVEYKKMVSFMNTLLSSGK
ncbi:MAG: hypothetical protein HFE77_00725 [Clostridiales bacterium]|nr:hypothetical protein [Clostridiales bacterium]